MRYFKFFWYLLIRIGFNESSGIAFFIHLHYDNAIKLRFNAIYKLLIRYKFLNIVNMLTNQTLMNIQKICLEYQIENFSINPDGSVDVDGNVDLSSRNLTIMPVRFRRIMGNFNIQNNRLTKLFGAPVAVGGNFNCFNNKLKDLKDSPKWVGGDFYAYRNKLISLVGSPDEVVGNYCISGNEYLENLVGCTLKIGADFSFDDVTCIYSGDEDIEFVGNFFLNETNYGKFSDNKLPSEIINNREHLKPILKYQKYFQIWNEDLTFNAENFNDLIAEIEEGLR